VTAAREAVVVPLLLLTVALLGGLEPGARVAFVPPPLFCLVLSSLLVAALVRSGALDPTRLMHAARSPLANANGAVVFAALVAAGAQVFAMLTPGTGLPSFFVSVFFFVLLVNTLVAGPDRVRLLRSLAVIFGAGLILKFVLLAGLSQPASRTARVLVALFDAATFGSIAQDPQPAAAGYLAFLTVTLYLAATALLPSSRPPVRDPGTALRMQLPEA
jgi:hypothetical protein